MRVYLAVFLVFAGFYAGTAQVLTREDSLSAGLIRSNNTTVLSGYGQLKFQYDLQYKTGEANLTRNVLFIGHRFSDRIYFFSELELENARVTGGNPAGEISMEQLFIKFNVTRDVYLQAGLFIPRIGIINENHLPTTFNGNDRTYVETFIIPATWREIGVGLYHNVRALPGFNYSFAVMNGLDASRFTKNTGIVEGRQEGSQATASNLAVTASMLYYMKNWRLQASGYYGGTVGRTKRVADSLHLQSGAFGTPVSLVEGNAQYHNNGVSFRALAVAVFISHADALNRAYPQNIPSSMVGYYAELGYDLFRFIDSESRKNLVVFGRYEFLDMNNTIPSVGYKNGANRRNYVVAGLTFKPVTGVVVKADYVLRKTGDRSDQAIVTPFPQQLPYYTSNGFFNLGLGYSF